MNKTTDSDLIAAKILLTEAQTRLATDRAEQAELKLAVMRKEYIPVADVNKQWQEQASRVKQRILALPTRLAGVISGRELSAGEIEGLAQGLITEALSELADSPTIEEPEVNDD